MRKKTFQKKRIKRLLVYLFFLPITLFILIGIVALLSNGKFIFFDIKHLTNSTQKTITPTTDLRVKASIPYWDQGKALTSFYDHSRKTDSISLFWYYISEDGEITKYEYAKEDKKIIENAHNLGVKSLALIANLPEEGSWDSERIENLISDDATRQKHVQAISNLITENGFDGVSIDYEELDPSLRQDFTEFIKELSISLHKNNKIVGVALHPKNGKSNYEARDGSGSQDWEELSQYADELYVMAYGEHWDEGEPGPIASISWITDIAEYATSLDIDMKKMYLGIPLYGYAWKVDSDEAAKGLVYTDIQPLLSEYNITPKWDDDAKAPYFSYDDDDESYEVWYENKRSVTEKIELAKKYGFGGVALWRLGGEDPGIWDNL